MRQETVNVYQFSELSEEAKDRAINSFRESMDWSYESEVITEDFEYELGKLGLPTDDIEWRLSHSQGDGVAFYGNVDMGVVARRLLEGESLKLYKLIEAHDLTISAKLYRNSYGTFYSHYNTMNVEMDTDDIHTIVEDIYDIESDSEDFQEKYEIVENLISELEEIISDDIKDVSMELERRGYDAIDYYNSDEAISETIIANGYEYTVDGKMY